MLKKTCAVAGLLFTTAAGALITSMPASAQTPTDGFGGGCCSSSHHQAFLNHHRNRNWNGNENESFNRIRLRLHNRNNNIAVARVPQEERRRPIIVGEREREG